jgi:acyl-coenzyme A thioesterase 13
MDSQSNTPYLPANPRIELLLQLKGKHMTSNFSPVAKWLNGKLIDVAEGSMEIEYEVREDMCNPMRTLHGGIASTILDDIVGTMVYALGREFAFTSVNLNCDFLNPAVPGDILTAKSQVIRSGKNIIHVEGQLFKADGRIVAKCASNLIQTSFKIPEPSAE